MLQGEQRVDESNHSSVGIHGCLSSIDNWPGCWRTRAFSNRIPQEVGLYLPVHTCYIDINTYLFIRRKGLTYAGTLLYT